MTNRTIARLDDVLFGLLALGLVAGTAACGGSDGSDDGSGAGGDGGPSAPSYKDQNLQGTVDGSSWTFTHGTIENFGGNKRIELYAAGEAPDDPCTFDVASYEGWTVNFSASLEEKRFELSTDRFLTFSNAPDNIATKTGWFELTSVGDSQIEGQLVAKADGDHVVNGNFTAARCENQ
jgi:hypothetical protein